MTGYEAQTESDELVRMAAEIRWLRHDVVMLKEHALKQPEQPRRSRWRYVAAYGSLVVCIVLFAVLVIIGGNPHTSVVLFTAVWMADVFSGVFGLIAVLTLSDGWDDE